MSEIFPICPYFGQCGGCQTQDLSYSAQLDAKSGFLRELLAPFWEAPIPVMPSPVTLHYRNKVDPSFAGKQYETPPPKGFVRETVLGFKQRGRWYAPLEIDECRIAPEGLPALLDAVRVWQRRCNLRAYDFHAKDGFLRVLLVRDAKRTGQRMVCLVTRPGPFDAASFVDAVQSAFPCTSIYRGSREGAADVAFSDQLELLHGAPVITERLHVPDPSGTRELTFEISPNSFFQTNPRAAENLYGAIRAWVRETAPRHLFDLYGGMGSIAFACADLVPTVESVEEIEDATRDGIRNAALNGITNVRFTTANVRAYLREKASQGGLPPEAAVILDPPRGGMHPRVVARLLEQRPRDVLYVSCNPKLLAQDLTRLREGYEIRGVQAFDLFPHTRHVEAVASLRRR